MGKIIKKRARSNVLGRKGNGVSNRKWAGKGQVEKAVSARFPLFTFYEERVS